PGRGSQGDLLDDRLGVFGAQAEIFGARQREIDVARCLVESDVRCKDAWANIRRSWIQIVDRREGPTLWTAPQETVIAQVIVHVRDQDIEHHSSIELTRILSRPSAIPRERIDQLGITTALAIFQAQHREPRQERHARICYSVEAT